MNLCGSKIVLAGRVTENTLVTADTADVTADIIIADNITLNISAGTVLSFKGNYNIFVEGSLKAEGTAENRIVFTSFKPDTPGDFEDHSSSWGGIIFDNTLSTNDSSSIRYSVFEYAKTIDGSPERAYNYLGGAVFINNFSKVTIENCIFRYNTALYGAAIGAINCQAQINNNLFYENYAKFNGSVAYFVNSYPYFYNNTAIDNIIDEINPDYQMGAIYNFRSKPLFANNIIRDNITGYFPEVYFYKEYFMHSNNIRGFSGFNGNFDEDPIFDGSQIIPGILLENSPCIDTGVDFNLPQPQFDLMGNARIVNGNVDIGAFENQTGNSISYLPEDHVLLQIYPNPSNPNTRIRFFADKDCEAEIMIFDVKGNMLKKISPARAIKGENIYDIKLDKFISGLYIVKLITQHKSVQGKFLLLK